MKTKTHLTKKETHTTMKILIYTLMGLAVALIIFNVTLLDFNNLFEGNSFAAAVGIVLSLCAICALLILKISKNIEEKSRN
ncbi:MAG: hypothetical protein DI539_14395 [Flavobacterium psychrophilum]|nr:MAG: hypothetical protein DI539_14395 [Flavobacterium psychrophilum]